MDDIVLVAGGLMVASLFLILGVSELLLSLQQGVVPLPPGSTPGMCHTALQGYMPVKYARHTKKFFQIMTKNRLLQIHEDSANGLIRPNQACVLLTSVCEYALELEAKLHKLQKQSESLKSKG